MKVGVLFVALNKFSSCDVGVKNSENLNIPTVSKKNKVVKTESV